MCYTLCYILLIFRLFFEVQTLECTGSQYQNTQSPGCDAPEIAENSTSCIYECMHNPDLKIVNHGNGTVLVRFPLPPLHCAHTKYVVNLMIDEQVHEESNCNEHRNFKDKHSIKDYVINRCANGNCGGKPCDEYGEVTFNYIFTSCYMLLIRPIVASSSRSQLESCPFFISTNFTKLKIAEVAPTTVVSYDPIKNVCSVDVKYHEAISKTAIELNFYENGSRVHGGEVSVQAGINGTGPGECIEKPNDEATPTVCKYKKDNLFDEIVCTFPNVQPGNYCVRMKVIDDRCEPSTIWTVNNTSCRWSTPYEAKEPPPNMAVISMPLGSSLTVFLILLGVAVGGLLILVLFWRIAPKTTNWSHAESSEEAVRPIMEGLKVLLLYPRDCQDFMNTMESFRKLLETYNIEVYDCHASDEVLNGPLYWLQKVMAYPKLCTVIVSSHCAYLQQQAIQMGCNITSDSFYKDPIFIDSIFMYGLKIIMEDVSVDTYLKNFVIGFSGFSSDEKMLTLPTSFRRYRIPEHLPKLLVDMNLELTLENNHICDSIEYIELQNKVKTLVSYVTMKPQYLEDIMNLV